MKENKSNSVLKKVFSKDFNKKSEKEIEAYLRSQIEKLGGIAYKFTSPHRRSVPDRLCLLPKGVSIFIECKRLGQPLTDNQRRESIRIARLNHAVTMVDSIKSVDNIIKLLKIQIEAS